MDLVHDNLADSRSIRILTMLDEAMRECIHMEMDTWLSTKRVIGYLDRLCHNRKLAEQIGVDQDTEFTSNAIKECFRKTEQIPGPVPQVTKMKMPSLKDSTVGLGMNA